MSTELWFLENKSDEDNNCNVTPIGPSYEYY